ncbi:hypothetical protein MMC22_007241 [Lobaria immixta]|nr:hypothetical protein [Lobaria immixta]
MANVERLVDDKGAWLGTFGQGAYILRDTYTVVLHGIAIATIKVQRENWETISRVLLTENFPRFASAEIIQMGWLSKGNAKVKVKTSITIAFSTPEDANLAIPRAWHDMGGSSSRMRTLLSSLQASAMS